MGARATWICARATRRGARASDVCKGHILCLYTKILIWCKGLIFCLLKFWNILRPLHHFLWPLHMALAPLLVALALALAPRKMLLFSRLSGRPCSMKALIIQDIPNQILPHVTEYELSSPIRSALVLEKWDRLLESTNKATLKC